MTVTTVSICCQFCRIELEVKEGARMPPCRNCGRSMRAGKLEPNVTYRPRNDNVLIRVEKVESVNGIAMPDSAVDGHRYVVEAVGPQVEDLNAGDVVFLTGLQNVDWAYLPNTRKYLATKERFCNMVVVEKRLELTPSERVSE